MISVRLALFILVCGAVVLLNVLPIKRGGAIYCVSNVGKTTEHMIAFGLPFTAVSSKGSHGGCWTSDEWSEMQTETITAPPIHSIFLNFASVWFDLIIDGAAIFGAYLIWNPRRVMK